MNRVQKNSIYLKYKSFVMFCQFKATLLNKISIISFQIKKEMHNVTKGFYFR